MQSVSNIWYENGIYYLKNVFGNHLYTEKPWKHPLTKRVALEVTFYHFHDESMCGNKLIMVEWGFLTRTVWKLSFYLLRICGRVVCQKIKSKHSLLFKVREGFQEKDAVNHTVNQWTLPCESGNGWVGVVRCLWMWVWVSNARFRISKNCKILASTANYFDIRTKFMKTLL